MHAIEQLVCCFNHPDAGSCLTQPDGFLSRACVEALARDPRYRLTQVLVRCGAGRFVCAAQDVLHFVTIIEADGRDYVRDLSRPCGR